MLVLNAADVRRALPMTVAIAAMKQAFAALSTGRAVVPHRAHLSIPGHAGLSLIMPAYVADPSAESLAVKVVSLFDGNRARGLARIQAAVVVLEPDTGRPVALLEGSTLTAIRTAAASGAATDLLARRDSRALAILGAGVQARAHVEAICAVRTIEAVAVYSPTPAKVDALIADLLGLPGITASFRRASSARDALRGADVVCATTTSSVPVFEDADLARGVHVNAVGSFTAGAREVPQETVLRALVVVDSREAAWEEAGDLIQPLRAGLIARDHIHAELGELVAGLRPACGEGSDVTLFKSVGIAVQDAVAARHALVNARRIGLGTEVPW